MQSTKQSILTVLAQPKPRVSFMELMEPRQFLTVTTWSSAEITPLSGDFYAAVLMGDNGNPEGMATASAGTNGEQEVWETPEWDANLDDGLDSGWVSMAFSVNSGDNDTASWQVSSEAVDTFAIDPDTMIQSVTIRAVVAGQYMAMDFKNLVVKFYNGTTVAQTITVRNFGASTMSAGSVVEKGAIVTGSASSYTGVVVTGQFRLQGVQGVYPAGYDIFGQVLIN